MITILRTANSISTSGTETGNLLAIHSRLRKIVQTASSGSRRQTSCISRYRTGYTHDRDRQALALVQRPIQRRPDDRLLREDAAGAAASKLGGRLVRGPVDHFVHSFAYDRRLGFLAFLVGNVRFAGFLAVATQVELNEAFHAWVLPLSCGPNIATGCLI